MAGNKMISSVEIHNFKRFRELEVRFAPMTVLTGLNSAGKSSVIQALLLLTQQRSKAGRLSTRSVDGLNLGESSELLNLQADDHQIRLGVVLNGARHQLILEVPDGRSHSLLAVSDSSTPLYEPGCFVYLSAERLGPRDLQEIGADREEILGVGPQGEYTAHVLAQAARNQVERGRLHPATDDIVTLSVQTEKWLSAIVGPTQVDAEWLPRTSAATLRFRSPSSSSDWMRPANVGFGITYALPIIVAALSTPASGALVVENPECHLHPAGQKAMGRFLAQMAASGLQVVVETHSDHILNGIRLAVAESVIDAKGVAINFFTSEGENSAATSGSVDEHGQLSFWPDGFFDEYVSSLLRLSDFMDGDATLPESDSGTPS